MGNCTAINLSQKAGGKNIYVAFSGGKDSSAMLIRMIQEGWHIDEIVFADTGMEFPQMYEYIGRMEAYIERKITRLEPKIIPAGELFDKNAEILESLEFLFGIKGKEPYYPTHWKRDTMICLFDFWMYGVVGTDVQGNATKNSGKQRGFPLSRFSCWYTREAKVYPMVRYMRDAKEICQGIAVDEAKRYKKASWITGEDGRDRFMEGAMRYPLVEWGWTELDCAKYLDGLGMLNPLYKNYNRTGCMPCPKQNEAALYVLWKLYPDFWNGKLKHYERENELLTGKPAIFLTSKNIPITLEELEQKFQRKGYSPKNLPKYGCNAAGCDVASYAFSERITTLEEFG